MSSEVRDACSGPCVPHTFKDTSFKAVIEHHEPEPRCRDDDMA